MSSEMEILKPHFTPENIEALNKWFDERMKTHAASKETSMTIMVTKGTLDWAYPVYILASTASALGWNVTLFFTFYGLKLLQKDLNLKISPLGNPAMPMKMPFGPEWFKSIDWNIPNLVMAGVPGFESIATGLMKKTISNNGVASIEELRELCIEAEVKVIACQMTVELFGMNKEDFIPEVNEWAGATAFLDNARDADIVLYI